MENLNLVSEPHPRPYTIPRLGGTSFHVTKMCLIPILMHIYYDLVWCYVKPMTVAHLLLGQDWIECLDVDHEEGDIYSFKHEHYTIKLIPFKPKEEVQQDAVKESNEEIP